MNDSFVGIYGIFLFIGSACYLLNVFDYIFTVGRLQNAYVQMRLHLHRVYSIGMMKI